MRSPHLLEVLWREGVSLEAACIADLGGPVEDIDQPFEVDRVRVPNVARAARALGAQHRARVEIGEQLDWHVVATDAFVAMSAAVEELELLLETTSLAEGLPRAYVGRVGRVVRNHAEEEGDAPLGLIVCLPLLDIGAVCFADVFYRDGEPPRPVSGLPGTVK